jgi:hypothetical protein
LPLRADQGEQRPGHQAGGENKDQVHIHRMAVLSV